MSCQTVRNSALEFLDQTVAAEERTRVTRHLAQCRECALYFEQFSQLQVSLKSLPQVSVPQRLRTQLQIVASRERARWNSNKTLSLTLENWAANIKLAVDNLMRPLAVPLAGGLTSALMLFSVLVPTLGFRPVVGNDVPISFYTAATLVETSPVGVGSDETVVELYVDSRGQATDYSVQQGKVSPELQADLNHMLFFSRFTPATWFGQPTNGKVLVSFRCVKYVVRG